MRTRNESRVLPSLLAAVFVVGLSGCALLSSVGGWISQRYENTVSYFNAYYNAKRAFDEAEAEILTFQRSNRGKVVPAGQAQQIPMTARQKLNVVIDKCSNILSFYPQSGLVDDAIFLIGKSYYYQGEYVRAERKFSELLAQFPNGPLVLDGQLWFLKTLDKLGRSDDALSAGELLVAEAERRKERRIAGEAYAILADVSLAKEQRGQAIEHFQKAVEVSRDGLLRGTCQARIGDLYAAGGQHELAAAAYLTVPELTSDVYLLYYSRLQAAVAFRTLKRYDSSVALLDELIDDFRFNEYIGTVRLELGKTLTLSGRYSEAIDEYRYVDTTFARTEAGARAAFELGSLYRNHLGDYEKARAAYDRVSATTIPTLTQEAVRLKNSLTRYFSLHGEFAKVESVLTVLDVDSLWVVTDTIVVSAEAGGNAPGTDSLLYAADSVSAASDTALVRIEPDTSVHVIIQERILPRPSPDSLRAILAATAYQLGEVFYAEIDEPDSAFYWYNQSLKLHADSLRAPRAIFILAQIAGASPGRTYGDPNDLYEKLLSDYPESPYVERARIALGLPPVPRADDPAVPLYMRAESLIDRSQYFDALQTLRSIVEGYPNSPLAAKSSYAIGWIYEHRLSRPDSALEHYKALVERFGKSEYAETVKKRIPSVVAETPASSPDTVATPPVRQPEKPAAKAGILDLEQELPGEPAVRDTMEVRRDRRRPVR